MRDVLLLQFPICDVHVTLSRPLPLAAGETNPARQVRLTPGGGATTAIVGARLGLDLAQAGVLGDDPAGSILAEGYAEAGVETSMLRVEKDFTTPCAVVLNGPDGNHAFASVLDGRFPDFPDLRVEASRSRMLLVSGYMLIDHEVASRTIDFARSSRASGSMVVLDPGPIELTPSIREAWVKLLDVLVLNESEAERWSGVACAADSAAALHARMRPSALVVVKAGPDGCVIASAGGRVESYPGFRIDVVDTTGAGDSFIAGLMLGLRYELPLALTADLANAAGAATAAREGCGPEAAERTEIRELLLRAGSPAAGRL